MKHSSINQDGQRNTEEARITTALEPINEAERKGVALELVEFKDFLNSASSGSESALKEEIIRLISPILSPRPQPDAVLDCLNAIVLYINTLRIIPEWRAEPEPTKSKVGAFPRGWLYGDWLRGLGPGKKILNLAGKKYRVRHDWREETGTQRHYLAIIDALEDGTFVKLKKCNQCEAFFIADRLSNRFCSGECSETAFGGEAAKSRVYAIRQGQRNLAQLLDAKRRETLPLELKTVLRRLGTPVVNDLRERRRRGIAIAKLWKFVPAEVKKRLKEVGSVDQDD